MAILGGVALLQVLVDPAGNVAQSATGGDRVHIVAHSLDEVTVVTDHNERARPAIEQILERSQSVDIEVVRGLVQQQHIRPTHQQPHQRQAPSLATG